MSQTLVPPVSDPSANAGDDSRSSVAPEAELTPGVRVEVRNRLDGAWVRGFEIIGAGTEGFRLRRLSDGGELPLVFPEDDIRKEKKRGMWWY